MFRCLLSKTRFPILGVVILMVYLMAVNAGAQTQGKFTPGIHNHNGTKIPFQLFIPKSYNPSLKYPLILYLHGAVSRGTDNLVQLDRLAVKFYIADSNQTKNPAFVLVPQCPKNQLWVDSPWENGGYNLDSIPKSNELAAVESILDSITRAYSIDTKRLYATGESMGGFGVWDLITRNPTKFAAAIPAVGAGDPTRMGLIRHMGIWGFHGNADKTVPVSGTRNMFRALDTLGVFVFYTDCSPVNCDGVPKATVELLVSMDLPPRHIYSEVKGADHIIWEDYFNRFGHMYDWLLSFTNQSAVVQPPVADKQVSGELKVWHKITVTFDGPEADEGGTPNPFLNYRLNVTFSHGDKAYTVPGYFAADGDAANSGAVSGKKWRAHFSPNAGGVWTYKASFREGDNVAISLEPNAGKGASFDGASGSFTVGPTDKSGRDCRGKGWLQYVGEHHLRFAGNGEWFLKAGADAPENLLAYEDFDNTPNNKGFRKSWSAHVKDWKEGDAIWKDGKGKGIIGAINYLASEGMNVFSFLTMNIKGDDQNVFMYVKDSDPTRIDISKTGQWEKVFEHGTKMGMYLHFKTQETENDQLLDGGKLGVERKLYYRELVARFGHHPALNWNVGEENTNTHQQRLEFAEYFDVLDVYDHNIVIHTYPRDQEKVYKPLLGDQSKYTGASVQTGWNNVHSSTLTWVDESAKSGRKWVVANDEQGGSSDGVKPDGGGNNHAGIRQQTLWGNFMAGGAGVEYYFGYKHPHSDLTCQDFRSRDIMWDYTRYALQFFKENLPFWEMRHDDDLTADKNDFVLAKKGVIYVIYRLKGGAAEIDLSGASGEFEQKWYNPRTGKFAGEAKAVSVGGKFNTGVPPSEASQDWAVLIVKKGYVPPKPIAVTPPEGGANSYQSFQLTYRNGILMFRGAPESGLLLRLFDTRGKLRFKTTVYETSRFPIILSRGLYFARITGKGLPESRIFAIGAR